MIRQFEKLNDNLGKILFWGILFGMAVLVGLYGYFLNDAIRNVVLREKAHDRIVRLNSDIAGLEMSYIALKNSVNLDLAYSLGFSDPKKTSFIAKKGVSQEVSLNRVNVR